MAIDLRNPQGEFGGSFQAAADILTSIQAANKAKANRNTLNEISKARALNPNATIDEIIAGLPQTQGASGIAGFIQRITGAGQSDVLSGIQASRITTPVQEAQIKASEALATSRTAGKKTPATQATPEEKDRDRNAAVIERELKKKNPRQGLVADAVRRLKESTVLREIEAGGFNDAFENLIKELKPEVTRRQGFLGIDRDKVFGQETFDELLESAVLEGLKDGIDPKSIEAALLDWWNRQFEKEKGQEFQKFQRIGTGQPQPLPQPDDSIRPDGTQKGNGFLGPLQLPDGKVATEFSIGTTDVTGKEMDIPTLVPTLTQAEIDLMVNDIIPNNKPVPKSIIQKAIAHAKKRISEGKSVFAGDEEDISLISIEELQRIASGV